MTPNDQHRANAVLREHRLQETRIQALPDDIRPQSRADGYAIQALVELESESPLFGWKIAATSLAGQAHVAIDGPIAGRITREALLERAEAYRLGANHMRVAELEFAFRLRRDIAPRDGAWTWQDAVDEVEALHIAIEIPDSRFERYDQVGAAQLIADNACAHRFLLGPRAPEGWRALDLADHAVVGMIDNMVVERGVGRNVLGDPRIALAWFLDEQSRNQTTVRGGQVVTTGTCVQPIALRPGVTVHGDFGPLGKVSLQVVD